MTGDKKRNSKVHILLSEGSSTNVREMISALGPLGYTLDICDPNPICMGRFSRYIRKVYTCPVSGSDPVGYLEYIIDLLKRVKYDVLFPANEQAYLFAWAKDLLTPLAGLALADFSAFNRLQTKAAFMQTLDELQLPHPLGHIGRHWHEIEEHVSSLGMPCFVKTSYGTASMGVWRIEQEESLVGLKRILARQGLLRGETEFVIQAAAGGEFEQSHAVFDHGRLLAFHCTRRLVEGAQGGAAVKLGVNRPLVRQHFEKIGGYLDWHGSLSIDYFWDERTGQPSYIDANPRITEPMNALAHGINFADLQVRLSLCEEIPAYVAAKIAKKSHNAIQVMLGMAERENSRMDLLAEMAKLLLKRGIYRDSVEGLTPVWQDFPSIIPLTQVLLTLLVDPARQRQLIFKTISDYSLGLAIPRLSMMKPQDVF